MNRHVLVTALKKFDRGDDFYDIGSTCLVSEHTAEQLEERGLAEDTTAATVSYINPTDLHEGVDTSTVAWTIRMPEPAQYVEGTVLTVYDANKNAATNNITIKSYDGTTTYTTIAADEGYAQFYVTSEGEYVVLDLSDYVEPTS